MIHEYALEPELVATWSDPRVARYFVEQFGLGQPRIVSRYPKRWKRLVWEAFHSDNDIERTRMVELIARLSESLVKRRDWLWELQNTWLENAQGEHERIPFHAILARQNPSGHPRVLIADDLNGGTPYWAVPRGVTITRSAESMADAVSALLRMAEVVIFVDPHFGPGPLRYRRSLEAFLRSLMDHRAVDRPRRLEIHTSVDFNGTAEFFAEGCRRSLPRCIPPGMRLSILRLRPKPGGDRLHNRYILTDLGGVIFGVGLDEGDQRDTDDVHLLDRAQYHDRWQQYGGDRPAFDRPEPRIELQGR